MWHHTQFRAKSDCCTLQDLKKVPLPALTALDTESLYPQIVRQVEAYNQMLEALNKHLAFFIPLEHLRYSATRYLDWLRLQAKHRDIALPRNVLIDLWLHTHLLHPRAYHRCCQQLFGSCIDLLDPASFPMGSASDPALLKAVDSLIDFTKFSKKEMKRFGFPQPLADKIKAKLSGARPKTHMHGANSDPIMDPTWQALGRPLERSANKLIRRLSYKEIPIIEPATEYLQRAFARYLLFLNLRFLLRSKTWDPKEKKHAEEDGQRDAYRTALSAAPSLYLARLPAEVLAKTLRYVFPPPKQLPVIVPTYDIDFIWHCHMRLPVRYASDCQAVFGELVDHDDRVPSKYISECASQTAALWKEAYRTVDYGAAGYEMHAFCGMRMPQV